jgi:hypothetical protein
MNVSFGMKYVDVVLYICIMDAGSIMTCMSLNYNYVHPGGSVGSGTVLQAGRSWVRFITGSLGFFSF